jgi:hypothetical protein
MFNFKNKKGKYFYPILAPDKNETKDFVLQKWDKFDALGENEQEKVSSKEVALKIERLGSSFNLSPEASGFISISIRNYYFGELRLEDMPFVLAKEMNIDLTKAKEITQNIIAKIINDNSQEMAYQANLEKLTLPEALKKYPEIGEQLITSNKIKIKNFPEPARPSLKNWLADYVMLLGRENHGAVERGNYLFQNENGKNLSATDRQHMNYILKCLDENTPVTINKLTKQILFPQISENNYPEISRPIQSPVEPKNNIQSVQFSYPQKTIRPLTVQRPSAPIIIPKPETRIIPGPNVVNLKD